VNLFIWRDGVETRIDCRILTNGAAGGLLRRTAFGQLCSELDQRAIPCGARVLLQVLCAARLGGSFVLGNAMLRRQRLT